MQTRSKAQKHLGNTPVPSPSPARSEDESGEKEQSPFVPSERESPRESPDPATPEASDAPDPDNSIPSVFYIARQSQNARSAPWQAWQDRFLIQEVDKLRPFNAARGAPAQDAWDEVAAELSKSSAAQGKSIGRTGAACRARFQKLLKAHQVRHYNISRLLITISTGGPNKIPSEDRNRRRGQ
jgi:hypothetical protein